jgi:hypothetical protein
MNDKKLIAVVAIGFLLLVMNLCCLFFNAKKSLHFTGDAAIADHRMFDNDEFFNAGANAVLQFLQRHPNRASQSEFDKYIQTEYLKKIEQGGEK